jgi:hypothetical protein
MGHFPEFRHLFVMAPREMLTGTDRYAASIVFYTDRSLIDGCNDLLEDGVEVEIMCMSSNVELEGNDIVDKRARHAALNDAALDRPLPPVNFQRLATYVLFERVAGLPSYFSLTLV